MCQSSNLSQVYNLTQSKNLSQSGNSRQLYKGGESQDISQSENLVLPPYWDLCLEVRDRKEMREAAVRNLLVKQLKPVMQLKPVKELKPAL